jgi:hypothetical protein
MKRVMRATKITRVLRVKALVKDLLSDLSDEEIMAKHDLRWDQLEKVYHRLFHSGYLSRGDMLRRIELRDGQDASHIPYAELVDTDRVFLCAICGFSSRKHFSMCPRCSEVNLRRLYRRIHPAV